LEGKWLDRHGATRRSRKLYSPRDNVSSPLRGIHTIEDGGDVY
jgi:hypothetical protein